MARMKYLVLLAFVAIVGSLGSALFFMMRDGRDGRPKTSNMARALAFRVGFSVLLFLCILVDWKLGVLRPLAQLGPRRWEAAAAVPTARELGFDVVEGSMRGVAAPAGVPREVLDRLVAAVRQAMENPEFRQLAAQQALPLRFLDPDAYRTELFGLRTRLQQLWAAHAWRERD